MFYWIETKDKKAKDGLCFHIGNKDGKCLCSVWIKGNIEGVVDAKAINQPRLFGQSCKKCIDKFLESL